MKPVKDQTLDAMEDAALAGAKALKAFFAYDGDNPKHFAKARMGAASISAYSRVRASESNRAGIVLSASKQIGMDAAASKALLEEAGVLPVKSGK